MASMRGNLGVVLHDFGDLHGAKAEFEQALAIGEAALGSTHPDMATWRGNLGVVLYALGTSAAREHSCSEP